MKNSVKLALGLAAILILMVITKPDEESFERFLAKKYDIENKNDSDDIEGLLNKALKSGVNIQANVTKTYTDKTLFAEVTTKEMLEEEHYIGLFGFWINTNK
jgi:hypothetical protein